MKLEDALPQSRQILIEHVGPQIDCGRYPIKRIVGDQVEVQADILREGHDLIAAAVNYRRIPSEGDGDEHWQDAPMYPRENDRWTGAFAVTAIGRYCYRIEAWNDLFATWQNDMRKRIQASQVTDLDIQEGIALVTDAAERMQGPDAAHIAGLVGAARNTGNPIEAGALFLADSVTDLMRRHADRSSSAHSAELEIVVDPPAARFSAWYELFPRSQGKGGEHGTLADVIEQLPRIAGMGFDILYLPPIHPIGRSFRKGPNNGLEAGPNDVGSPWAIGNENGGHKAIEPALGTFEDFDRLVREAARHGIQICLDFAIQCSPDHPYVREHPDWFFVRPDGSIKYAENPPKKYQDIYPLNFYGSDRRALWEELKSIVDFWIERGVTVFRVDNPHTKPVAFWEWMIGDIKNRHPETIFLAEAFTRPNVMRALAKAGFTQSYTYFTWRNTRWEITDYLSELTQSEMKEYFRGNLWPNTPDILNEFLQHGGLPAFRLRLALAATLSPAYGIYSGYELGQNVPASPGSEEYLNSDKYQINEYNWNQPHYLGDFITRVNRIRRQNPALHLYDNLRFYHSGSNDNIIVYGKATPDGNNRVLVVVNLNPYTVQETWVGAPFWEWGFGADDPYAVHDLLTGESYTWHGEYNFVRLDPQKQPAHIFLVRRSGEPLPAWQDIREIDFS